MGLPIKSAIFQINSLFIIVLILVGCSPPSNYSSNYLNENPSTLTQSYEIDGKDGSSNNENGSVNNKPLNNENTQENQKPFFVYASDKTYVIDYENNKIATAHRILNVDKRFLSLDFSKSMFNTNNLSKSVDLPMEDCDLIQNVFILDYYAISNC